MYKVLIIDDEIRGREMVLALLKKYFDTEIDTVAVAESVDEGVKAVTIHHPEIIFLDIEMPNVSGFELFNRIRQVDFEVIFVTAFSDYAIKAFKVNAVDYILKPLDVEEFKAAVSKAIKRIKEKPAQNDSLIKVLKEFSKPTRIGLPLSEGSLFISVSEIVRCESSSNYTNIYLDDGKHYLICRTLKEVEESLKGHKFFRAHRSHLINLEKVKMYSKSDGGVITMSDHTKIPVSRQEKESLENILSSI
ncbi:MAG: LytTR family DNA-binding domain-containing protein [Cyclobacteriaceae bacterium]